MYFVYILTNQFNTVLYTGYTSNLIRRVQDHKERATPSFTNKYLIDRCVYFEIYSSKEEALKRERQVKKYKRVWKIEMIEKMNPDWVDLSSNLNTIIESTLKDSSIRSGLEGRE